MLIETASSEIASRDLLHKPSFAVNGYPFDPFTQDPAPGGEFPILNGIDRVPPFGSSYSGLTGGTGMPICYDPLWWYQVNLESGGTIFPSLVSGSEFRFASGIGAIRNDPSGGAPSAHGLMRITNFPVVNFPTGVTYGVDPAALVASADDLVMQTDGTADATQGRGSPLVPDLSTNSRLYDYSFSWIFTGKQTDTTNGTIFDGDLVVFHNRPFAVEVNGGGNAVAAGERVVEAIWGYSSAPVGGYGRSSRTVLLRWSAAQPDPDVRQGGWIADVTYERFNGAELSRFYNGGTGGPYPAQRCHWYRVSKRTDPTNDPDVAGHRQMIVTLGSDVRSKTPIDGSGNSLQVNAALISPYVVNVVPRVFYSR
jgi:hypothetical protein